MTSLTIPEPAKPESVEKFRPSDFVDNKGRKWQIEITVAEIKSVRKEFNIDLYTAFDGDDMQVWSRLIENPVMVADVVFFLCAGQAKAANVTAEDFGRGLKGDAIAAAANALTDAMIDFFPKARTRDIVRAILIKSKELREAEDREMLSAINCIDVAKMMQKKPSTSSPESSASIPIPSP